MDENIPIWRQLLDEPLEDRYANTRLYPGQPGQGDLLLGGAPAPPGAPEARGDLDQIGNALLHIGSGMGQFSTALGAGLGRIGERGAFGLGQRARELGIPDEVLFGLGGAAFGLPSERAREASGSAADYLEQHAEKIREATPIEQPEDLLAQGFGRIAPEILAAMVTGKVSGEGLSGLSHGQRIKRIALGEGVISSVLGASEPESAAGGLRSLGEQLDKTPEEVVETLGWIAETEGVRQAFEFFLGFVPAAALSRMLPAGGRAAGSAGDLAEGQQAVDSFGRARASMMSESLLDRARGATAEAQARAAEAAPRTVERRAVAGIPPRELPDTEEGINELLEQAARRAAQTEATPEGQIVVPGRTPGEVQDLLLGPRTEVEEVPTGTRTIDRRSSSAAEVEAPRGADPILGPLRPFRTPQETQRILEEARGSRTPEPAPARAEPPERPPAEAETAPSGPAVGVDAKGTGVVKSRALKPQLVLRGDGPSMSGTVEVSPSAEFSGMDLPRELFDVEAPRGEGGSFETIKPARVEGGEVVERGVIRKQGYEPPARAEPEQPTARPERRQPENETLRRAVDELDALPIGAEVGRYRKVADQPGRERPNWIEIGTEEDAPRGQRHVGAVDVALEQGPREILESAAPRAADLSPERRAEIAAASAERVGGRAEPPTIRPAEAPETAPTARTGEPPSPETVRAPEGPAQPAAGAPRAVSEPDEVAKRASDAAPGPRANVGDFPTARIRVDPERFQFKIGTSASGTRGTLRNVEEFDPDLGGTILVWRDPDDGGTYVVNGHHRLELAKRSGQPTMNVRFVDAEDASEARATGALVNMAEGRGNAIDVGKFLRETGITADELQARNIPVTESVVERGISLSRLHPSIFNAVSTGAMRIRRGATIGESGLSESQQLDLVKLIDRAEKKGRNVTDGMVQELADQIRGTPTRTETQETLFGTETFERSNVMEKAEISDYVRRQLAKDRRLFSYVSRGQRSERLAETGAGEIDVARAQELGQEAQSLEAIFNARKNRAGSVNDILNDASEKLAKGGDANAIKREATERIKQALLQAVPGRETPRPRSGGGAGGEGGAESGPVARDLFGEERPVEGGELPRLERDEPEGPELRFGGGPGTEQLAAGARDAHRRLRIIKEESAELGGAGVKLTSKILKRGVETIRDMGPAGKELAERLEKVAQKASKSVGTDRVDLSDVLKGMSRSQREKWAKAMNGRIPMEDLPKGMRARVEEGRRILDRKMNEFANLGGTREGMPVRGSGKAFPQVPNRDGRKFLEAANDQGLADDEVAAFAEDLASRSDAFETAEDVVTALREMREARVRGVNPYLERTRIELPEELVEWDPQRVLPRLLERNAYTVEGWREFGAEMLEAEDLVARIGDHSGVAAAREVMDFVGLHFGRTGIVNPHSAQLAGTISNYETLIRLGYSVLSALRNMGQRTANTAEFPLAVQLRALKEYPPFLNPWVKGAEDLERAAEKAGAVFAETSLGQVEGSAELSHITRTALKPFTTVERGNQVYTALVAKIGLENDIRTLIEAAESGSSKRVARLKKILAGGEFGAREFGGGREGAAARRVERLGIDNEELADIIMKGGELTDEQIDAAMHRLVSDTQFPLHLATERLWWRSKPWARLLAKFKPFALEQTSLIYNRAVKEAVKGNPAPLAKFVGWTILSGEIYNLARDGIFGGEESLTSRLTDSRESDTREIGMRLLNNLADGGGVGILADLVWGVGPMLSGPAGSTAKGVSELIVNTVQKPEQVGTALKEFARGEVSVGRQAEALWNRLDRAFRDENNRYISSRRWRDRAFDWEQRKENEEVKDIARNTIVDAVAGRVQEFRIGERSLSYEYASRAITAGDTDDATDYLTRIFKSAENPRELGEMRKAALSSMQSRAPLGPIAKNERTKFLRQFSAEERREARRLQQDWIRDYRRAVNRAMARARRSR